MKKSSKRRSFVALEMRQTCRSRQVPDKRKQTSKSACRGKVVR